LRILIIENEVYLAQSIATKLTELGHTCETCTSARDAMKNDDFDVVLLSTSLNSHDITPIIETFQDAIIILMVSYISNDTVSKPLSAGAKDYIVKPFMIEELVRKIDHHQDYERLKRQSQSIEKYLDYTFKEFKGEYDYKNITLPVFLYSSVQKNADGFAYLYAKAHNTSFTFVNLNENDAFEQIQQAPENALLYIINYQTLKKSDKKTFCDLIHNKYAIVSSSETIDDVRYRIIEISNDGGFFAQGDIMPIEDYVKYIVINFQHKYPDTELSKKLGISRKSLWEKRKKYDIIKKK
jgi:DNA-binding response OmpR family regulator